MQIAVIVGQATATVKHRSMHGWKLLVAQPLTTDAKPDGEPMAQVLTAQHENETLRDDVVIPSYSTETALRNAAEHGAGHFKVPKVIER